MSDSLELEQWQNATRTRFVVERNTLQGVSKDLIAGDAKFMLSKQDRIMNQSKHIAGKDPFSNGTFVALKLVDDDDVSTPNTVTESEVQELVSSAHWKTVQSRLNEIDSPVALTRLLDAAQAGNAGAKRVEMIRARLGEVAPDEPQYLPGGGTVLPAFDTVPLPDPAPLNPGHVPAVLDVPSH